jgi:acyl phosphate:glycerol-3-phosphate acyltransferase
VNVAAAVLLVVAAFFGGAIPFGVVVSRLFFRRDLRDAGSGNIGAANALRTLGRRGAAVVLLLDALKGALPVVAGRALGGDGVAVVAAFAAVAGHCFSPFLHFRGGKGVATSFGAVVALSWPAGIAFALVWIAALAAFGYASVASMTASVAMPFVLWYTLGAAGAVYGLASALLILVMHRTNLARLRAGTENRLFKGRLSPPAKSERA